MVYQSEEEIFDILRGFENGTIKREEWRHNEHLTVACCYAFHNDFETALDRMRGGIFNLLKSFGVDLSKEMPYHETLTVFWMRRVYELIKIAQENSFVETTNKVLEKCRDKDLPLTTYSRELLFSDAARESFVEADLQISTSANDFSGGS